MCNYWALADLLPTHTPTPPLSSIHTVSLREVSPALGVHGKQPLPGKDPHLLWSCCGSAGQQGKSRPMIICERFFYAGVCFYFENDSNQQFSVYWKGACQLSFVREAQTLYFLPQGETALFLSAAYGCYDTARLLLLHGANLELHDRRGRKPTDMAREGMHHQVLELLLTHQMQRGPVTLDPASDLLWDDHALMYSPWLGSQGLPGRSASFSGIVGHRDMTPPPQK